MSNFVFIILIILLICWAANHYGLIPQSTGGINRQLLQATRGDRELAKRLMHQVRLKYPDKDEQWHVEKVLYDLERDGRYVPRQRGRSDWNMSRSQRRNMMEDMFFIGTLIWFLNMLSNAISGMFRQ